MKTRITQIKGLLLYLVGFMLACDVYATPIVIVAFALCWIAEGNLKVKLKTFLQSKMALLFVAFYLLHLIGMFYTKNVPGGWFDLQVKLSLLIFPIMLPSEGQMDPGKQKVFFYSFITGLVLNGLICLIYATWRYLTQHVVIFEYMYFSIVLHPSYYSMYIDVELVWIFHLLTTKYEEVTKRERILLFSAVAFLLFMLVLLQSKTGLAVSALVLFILIARYVILKKRWIIGIAALVVLLAGGTYIVNSKSSRFFNAEKALSTQNWDPNSIESTQMRHFVWIASWELVQDYPLTGVGTGYSRDALANQYAKDGFNGALKERLNAHDEYMQVLITLGVIGLVGLFACLLLPLFKCILGKRFVYMMFLLIIILNFLTESMLETQGGTMFYGLFNSLLMFNFVI